MNKIFLTIILIIYSYTFSSKIKTLKEMISKYEIIIENLDLSENNENIISSREITFNKQILIIPTAYTISSNENYQFKEYFSKNKKELLIGRLLVEKFIGEESYFYEFISSLPKLHHDFYHFSEKEKEEFFKRSLNSHNFILRKENYENLIKKIPSSEIPSQLLNFNLYNWASSIIDCYGFLVEKQYYHEVKKLYKYSTIMNKQNENNVKYQIDNEEILLIPGLNLFSQGEFKNIQGNNFQSSLFAYKDHIYLNSDRFIEEGSEILNEIQFQPNIELFQSCGKVINDFYHEEVIIKLDISNWSLLKFDLCKNIDCLSINPNFKNPKKNSSHPEIVLKNQFDFRFLNICQIDQLKFNENSKENEEIFKKSIKLLKGNKRISNKLYYKALLRCNQILGEYLSRSKKSNLIDDILEVNQNKNEINMQTILRYTISQKRIINSHFNMLRNRLIRENLNEINGDLKNSYI